MKATGIVRRIDDLGRVVIPKEIRRTMRIREGDPLEIYTSREGEVIFKKYSLLGGLEDFASQLCETMSRSIAGSGKRELLGARVTPALEQLMESRRLYQLTAGTQIISVADSASQFVTLVAAPILAEGDLLGCVLFLGTDPAQIPGDAEVKLAQTVAAFLGRHMES